MTPELAAFMAATPPRQIVPGHSLLDPYQSEIETLRSAGYTLARIREFLKTQNVTVSRTAVHQFLKSKSPLTTLGESK